MINFENFMDQFSADDYYQFIIEYDRFDRDGCIGECILRDTAEQWLKEINSPFGSVILVMRDIAMYSNRYFAKKYFVEMGWD